jgi:hypothetical protein
MTKVLEIAIQIRAVLGPDAEQISRMLCNYIG